MPYAAPIRCKCGQIKPCPEHDKPWRNASANATQMSGRDRARFRKAQLARAPYCEAPGCDVTDVSDLEADHIIEVADGGSMHDPANGQTLCSRHHALKTLIARRRREALRRSNASEL